VTDALLVGGVLIACFVAYNIGGATTGPAVGAGAVTKATAAALVSVCFFVVAALLVGNVSGAPASTSMTAVGAIVASASQRTP
jgi:phosphate/sulfate permease